MPLNILVVDDTRVNRDSIAEDLADLGHRVETHSNAFTALESLKKDHWDLILTDLCMPSMDGLQLLEEIKALVPTTAVVIMTAHGSVETAVKALHLGAADYLLKPFPMEQLLRWVKHFEDVRQTREDLKPLRYDFGEAPSTMGLVGKSPQMQEVFHLIEQFAARPGSVLITGETGTGKEMVARALHERSDRHDGPFVPVPCGAVPRELAESELFGHEVGAFTGATRRRCGHIEMAHGGTLLLDDVDDLPIEIQAKLLRAIQESTFQRVGGERLLNSNARIISTSKMDLKELAASESFRQDLFYRLKVLTIHLPPLRERKNDIVLLANHFLALDACGSMEPPKQLSMEAQWKLIAHDWPGNVRELRHAVEYALAVSRQPEIQANDLPLVSEAPSSPQRHFSLNLVDLEQLDLRTFHTEVERELLLWALKKAHGDQGKAAELLKIPRTTFMYRFRRIKPLSRHASAP